MKKGRRSQHLLDFSSFSGSGMRQPSAKSRDSVNTSWGGPRSCRWGSSDSLTPRAQKQQTGRVPHLGASFPKLNSPTGEAFRSQPPPWIKCVQFRPPLRTTLKEECLGQISGGGWKVKENNTCLCSWPTDGALMYRLLGNGGVSGYLEASACSGACGKEFCDQKM